MATKKTGAKKGAGATRKTAKPVEALTREQLEQLIYGQGGVRRFTQDSPVLPDVWAMFGKDPSARVDLLLNPHFDSSPGLVAQVLEERLTKEQSAGTVKDFPCNDGGSADIAYNQSTVVARLCFRDIVRVVLPMTPWWNKFVLRNDGHDLLRFIEDKELRQQLAHALDEEEAGGESKFELEPQLIWMMLVVGTIAVAARRKGRGSSKPTPKAIVEACAELMRDLPIVLPQHRTIVWSVARNRPATTAVWRSTMAVKADAARRLFEISCKDLSWAVLDSGIDATHIAFRARQPDGKPYDQPFEQPGGTGAWQNRTRILATYDFTLIRYLLRSDSSPVSSTLSPSQQKRLVDARRRMEDNPERAKDLRLSLQSGRNIDWDVLKPLLEVPHTNEYVPARHDHGTHVAGILAADWRKNDPHPAGNNDISGVCPDLRLYDLRVLDEKGQGDEFAVMAALQFVRHLNAHKDYTVVHGVNLSISIRHDVANYACGSTPICEEATRLVGAGVVVVAAAGNNGYLYFMTSSGVPEEGYRSISITDPGNTEGVITVGATHRERAHTYGVSYFSSRGPTGDGRLKPDLVAPGEKIVSVVPNNETKRMDGTSMAAPHVSGAAALLLARHLELIGRPVKVKEILCATATDLGRERYFQGAGMVDILRALQSV